MLYYVFYFISINLRGITTYLNFYHFQISWTARPTVLLWKRTSRRNCCQLHPHPTAIQLLDIFCQKFQFLTSVNLTMILTFLNLLSVVPSHSTLWSQQDSKSLQQKGIQDLRSSQQQLFQGNVLYFKHFCVTAHINLKLKKYTNCVNFVSSVT